MAASIPELIARKRDGGELTEPEIERIVKAIMDQTIQQAQLGALLMAIRLNGMTTKETVTLTRAMADSGTRMTWPEEWRTDVVDKHSTGGVGDKVSLVLAPALAACGCKVPMVSGRGLAHTGGTIDKLESIKGYTAELNPEEIKKVIENVGCCIVSQSPNIAPADKEIYKTRDVTATVDSIPLIASSIVSKKSVEGLNALVLDVKIGKAAWSEDITFIEDLARNLVSVSNGQGTKTTGLITRMDWPLGNMVGNALEVIESIQCLQGQGQESLTKLICDEGGYLLHSTGKASSPEDGSQIINEKLLDGSALQKFREMLVAQGVAADLANKLCDPNVDISTLLPKANETKDITATSDGYIEDINAMACALVANDLGAGRKKSDDILDLSVGLQIINHVGSKVSKGDVIIKVHHNGNLTNDHVTKLQESVTYSPELFDDVTNLIVKVIKE